MADVSANPSIANISSNEGFVSKCSNNANFLEPRFLNIPVAC